MPTEQNERSDDPRAGTIAATAAALRRGDTTSLALTEACLQQITSHNRSINAFIAVLPDQARAQARAADHELSRGHDRGPLHGIPVSLKDLLDVQGVPTTAASRVRSSHVAQADATVVARLRNAGAVFIGKTNLHEFAFGTTNEDSAYGPVHHPLDGSRSPGGSSGGSAASVAAGMAYASIGTDTGGSIRIPAAVCGLVGLKPALDDLPTDGVVPLSTTLDHVGPLCRSADDARLLYLVMRGEDALTAAGEAAAGARTDHLDATRPDLRGMRLGVLGGYFTSLLDAQIAACFEQACKHIADAGAILDDVTLPHAEEIATVYLHIVLPEAAAYHATALASRPEDYTPNVRIRLEMGRYVLAEDYVRAMQGRKVLRGEVERLLAGRTALILPSLAIPAPMLGVPTVRIGAVDEPVRNVMLRLTQLFNITGHPAISLPCGHTSEGLPAGLQVAGGNTRALLSTARAIERYLGPGTSG